MSSKEKQREYQKRYREKHKNKIRQKALKYYYENRDKALKDMELYRANNKEYFIQYMRDYHVENKEFRNEESLKWYYSNKDRAKENDRQKYIRNKEKIIARVLNWRVNNIEQFRITQNKYAKIRRKQDPIYAIRISLGSRLSTLLKGTGGKKYKGTVSAVLGCSLEDLKIYLESKFYPHPDTEERMTWNNYGLWHVDHIIPCIKFNLIDFEEQKKCFHWTNLQPLWAKHNQQKHASLTWRHPLDG